MKKKKYKEIRVMLSVPSKTITDLQKIHGIDAIDCIADLVKEEIRRQYNATK
jgi:hypothetical protein